MSKEFPMLNQHLSDDEYAFRTIFGVMEGMPICPNTGEAGTQEADLYVQAATVCLSHLGMTDETIADAHAAAVQRHQWDEAIRQEFNLD